MTAAISTCTEAATTDLKLGQLKALAVRSLAAMFDEESQLFCNRVVVVDGTIERRGLSPRYTVVSLLGLHASKSSDISVPWDIDHLSKSFVRDVTWTEGVGDLGLAIWLAATFLPDQLNDLLERVDLDTALDRYKDARQARTMELAWFLAGLSHAASVDSHYADAVTDVAARAYRLIRDNQGEYGLFGHSAFRKSLRGSSGWRIGNFADQIYPIYAMCKFATAFAIEEPLDSALQCAAALCGVQGDLGQWPWLLDSRTGRVSSRYPVYSVHQYGMAPMGLFALEAATGHCFAEEIYRGLRWIFGANELNIDMRDSARNLVWRCIQCENGRTKYWDIALSLFRGPKENAPARALAILQESRPYELGWLLYAFGKSGARTEVSKVAQ